jgi:hypothetical protein
VTKYAPDLWEAISHHRYAALCLGFDVSPLKWDTIEAIMKCGSKLSTRLKHHPPILIWNFNPTTIVRSHQNSTLETARCRHVVLTSPGFLAPLSSGPGMKGLQFPGIHATLDKPTVLCTLANVDIADGLL